MKNVEIRKVRKAISSAKLFLTHLTRPNSNSRNHVRVHFI